LSKKPQPTESLITYVTKRLEQISSDTPEDFSQTVYTPLPLSVVTSPQDTTIQSPKADEPDNIEVTSTTTTTSTETPPAISTSVVKTKSSTSSKSTSNPRNTKSEVEPPPFSATLDLLQNIYKPTKTSEPAKTPETSTLYPPKTYYPSSQSKPSQSERSSSSSWADTTSVLQQRIEEGQYFGSPPSKTNTPSNRDNSFTRSTSRLRTQQSPVTKSSSSKGSVETPKRK